MAAVSQPGSRAGLITALVIFVILFLVSTVLFFTTNADNRVNEKRYVDLKKQYDQVIKPTEMTEPDFQAIKDDQANRGRSAFDVMREQRRELIKLVSGNDTTTADALKSSRDVLDSVNKELKPIGFSVSGDI